MAIYVLKDIINYYNCLGSPVFTSFIDISKAYDRVNHAKLFQKMRDRSIPVHLVKFIAYWYVTQEIVIRWGSILTSPFKISNSIRQGGLLSPFLFNLYLDSLSSNLNKSKVGCVVGSVLVNHIAYADDMVLLAPSVRALQMLLQVCDQYAVPHDIIYNTDKTFCMVFWPKKYGYKCIPSFKLQNAVLSIVTDFKYLGVVLRNNLADDTEIGKRMHSIYAIGNTIINKFKHCFTQVKLTMFRSYCSNVYCCSLWSSYKAFSIHKAKVAHNDIFRALLSTPRWHSASALFTEHRTNNLDAILRVSSYSLIRRLLASTNSIVAAVCRSGVRVHSRMWQRWSVLLGVDWESLMLM